MTKRKALEENSKESKSQADRSQPKRSDSLGLSEHQNLVALIDPIRDSLDEVKKVYIKSLLSTGSSEISSEIFLDHLADSPRQRSISHEKIADIANYMQELEGKWLRPVLVLLTTDLLGHPPENAAVIAAALELIHNATLIHDDVIDESDVRRGRPTIWRRWGNFTTVLMGDLLYAKSMELTTSFGSLKLQQIIAQATARMCQGNYTNFNGLGI